MNIILLQDIDKVGEKYEVVTVKDGFARNFLIPTKKAVIANQANLAKLDELKQKHAEELAAHGIVFVRFCCSVFPCHD